MTPSTMLKNIETFKNNWADQYNYISLELTDAEIEGFIIRSASMDMALDHASDYLLSQGLAEVQE